jgi:hypothetical protein
MHKLPALQRLSARVLLGIFALGPAPAFAMNGTHARYASGTIDSMGQGSAGEIDATSPSALEFHAGASQLSIPYAQITSFNYREESRWHFGVLLTIVVGLLAPWQRVDRISIIWSDDHGTPEVATMVLSKQDGQGLLSILGARAVKACGGTRPAHCGSQTW